MPWYVLPLAVLGGISFIVSIAFIIRRKRSRPVEAEEKKYPFCPHCGFGLFYDTNFIGENNSIFICGFCRALLDISDIGIAEIVSNDATEVYPQAEATPLIFYGTDGCPISNQSIRYMAED